MTFALTITAERISGTHPLRREGTPPAKAAPRAAGALLLDATLADGQAQVTLPVWQQQQFNAIKSGTAAAVGGSGDLDFSVMGDGYITFLQNIQLDNTTGPFTGTFTVYFKWTWGGKDMYLGSLDLDNINNDAWTITTSGLTSLSQKDLKVYIAVDNAQDIFFWWALDFQLAVPTSNFPAFTPLVPPPAIGAGGGPPPTFPPPTPPPIGQIPTGFLAPPAIQVAPPPISAAGIPQPVFDYGSATTPPASAAFPEFTTHPPSPPVIVNSTQNTNTPIWVAPPQPPPSQATTALITISGNYGPPIGPALPNPIPPRTFMALSSELDDLEMHNGPELDLSSSAPHNSPKPKGKARRKHV